MKRSSAFLSAAVLALSLALCGAARAAGKPIVVYFSMPETDRAENMTQPEEDSTVVIGGKVLGNTQYVAQLIQAHTGADIFRIEPKKPYPRSHGPLLDIAQKEQRGKARPKMKENVKDLAQYDVIFLGYPNWWADLPMILYTFLEANDLSGKTIVPFITHGGSGFSRTIRTIATLQPRAKVVTEGLSIYRDDVEGAEPEVAAWLKRLGHAK